MEQDTIRARRIELMNDQGNVGMYLDGGGAGAEPGIIIYGPDGPQSALAMFVKRGEDSVPQIIINRAGGGTVLITVDNDGPLVYLQDEDGNKQEIRP